MSDPTPSDIMTLAGLALANGPWLGVRLRQLAEHAGQPLPEAVVDSAVSGSSRVLAQILDAEGRPSANPDHSTDPAALLGGEQALLHQQAGLDLPASLRALRLLRRAYDDLVRESWVDKDSRTRAHEDVERFFERMLIGHFLAWAGYTASPPAASPAADTAETERLATLVAQRESEVRRAMDAARQLRERATTLAAELAQALAWGKAQRAAQEALKSQLLAARAQAAAAESGAQASELATLKADLAAAQAQLETSAAEAKALEARRAELEARLAEAQSALAAQREVEAAYELALKEIDNAHAEAEASREDLRKGRQQAQEAVAKAESQTLLARRETEEALAQARQNVDRARAEAEAAREELRKAHASHATLASEAEAMRAHLAETGSRMSSARRAEEAELQTRLAQAQEHIQALEAEAQAARQDSEALAARLAEQEGLHAFKDERLREQSRAVTETQELLVTLGAAKKELLAKNQAAQAEAEGLRAALAALNDSSQAGHDSLAAEGQRLATELADLRQQLAGAEDARDASQKNAQGLEAERDSLAARLIEKGNALDQATRQGQAAATARDACASLLATHLALTGEAVAAVDAGGSIVAWNQRFPELFGLGEADRASPLETLLPLLAKRLQRPEAWLARVRELLADPTGIEPGLTLASTSGQTLVFRSQPTSAPQEALASTDQGTGGRLFHFQDVSLEQDMESLVREIEAITRYELGQSLTAFIHLPQELLDDPATSPEQIQKLTVIRDSGYRIVNTVNMAVDIFRMERGLYRMPPGRSLDLAVVARRAAKDLSPLAASRHIDLELLLGDSPLPLSTTLPGPGDPIPAHALAVNLLRNALEAAPRQSSVQASLRLDKKAKLLCLDITRPGTLSPDELARFFDKPVGQDPGDGLARARYAAKLIAETFHGSLTVTTSPDATTLALRLPKA